MGEYVEVSGNWATDHMLVVGVLAFLSLLYPHIPIAEQNLVLIKGSFTIPRCRTYRTLEKGTWILFFFKCHYLASK